MVQIPGGFSELQKWVIVFTAGGAFIASTARNVMALLRVAQERKSPNGGLNAEKLDDMMEKIITVIKDEGIRNRDELRGFVQVVQTQIELTMLRQQQRQP